MEIGTGGNHFRMATVRQCRTCNVQADYSNTVWIAIMQAKSNQQIICYRGHERES